ncbi:DUF1214 domain-containing protein [Paenochrobactrum sp. BZR 588]|uniref:DUF1214 domain-containing protein n=1 Tax=unclassified Paenochrobactrum TaxID=2639760 RepID=UPI0038536429
MRLILRNLSSILFALAIALGGGIWSARWALDHFGGFSELATGEWISYPLAGSSHADPYAKGRSARLGNLSLGAAEGLIFYARSSSDGRALMRGCTYKMSGTSPNARFWTLFATDDKGVLLSDNEYLPTSLLSNNVAKTGNGDFEITISPQAQDNNWLSVSGSGQFTLVMTLYDTPVASSASFSEITMPRITALRNESKC